MLDSLRFASWFWHKPDWARSWTQWKQSWLQLTGGDGPVFAAWFEKQPENPLNESGKRSLVRHKSAGVIDAAAHDQRRGARQTLFFLTPPHPAPPPLPPYLPHLESIKELREEGKNPSTGNVFTMPGKASGVPFKRLKHPCWIFWGLFLFFGGKFHEPLNQNFTRLCTANHSFSIQASSGVLLFLLS